MRSPLAYETTAAMAWLEHLTGRGSESAGHIVKYLEGLTSPRVMSTVVAAIVLMAAVLAARAHLTRRALRPTQRVRFDALPSDSFDPGPEEIDRYAAQLARARRAVRRGTSRSAHALRIRIDAVGDGTVHYRIEGHRRASSILGTSGFHEVELRPHSPDTAEPTIEATPTSPDGDAPRPSGRPQEPPP